MIDKACPYNDLPLLPPAVELETKAVLKQAIKANANLARLEGQARLLPHQGTLINSIVLEEAKDSSEIESIFTTQDELYRASAGGIAAASAATKEVMRYREALWKGFNSMQQRPITASTIIDIVSAIKLTDMDVRTGFDTKIVNDSTGETVYTPPAGETLIRDLLENLVTYIHADDDVDPLVKLAVQHYQFEAIHPFSDGNGRTGRILNILFLVHTGLLSVPVLYLSRYIIHRKSDYYRLLREVTENQAWEEWILFMLRAVEVTAIETTELIDRIRRLMDSTAEYVREKEPKIYSKDLIELIFREPYCKISWLVDADIAQRQTASGYLHKLERLGVLTARKIGRDKYFVNEPMMQLLAAPRGS